MARIISAFTQFFDDNGDPLVSGWLRFTESGTNNTDKATYADSDETIPNTNPLQLDGAGRSPSVFGSGAYNVRLYTDNGGAPGVQIQQFDPVGAISTDSAFSSWVATTSYDSGDIVTASNGKYYRSLTSGNQNQEPSISPSSWEEIQAVGAYNQYIEYAANELVIDSSGYLYRSLVASNLNNTPADNPLKWGDPILQTNLTANTLTHDMASDADYTLSTAENRYGRVIITDTGVVLTTGRNIIISTTERMFFVQNDTAQTLTFKTAAGTGIAIPAGLTRILACDGTNVVQPDTTAEDIAAGASGAPKVLNAALDGYPFAAVDDVTGTWALISSWNATAVASKDFTWDESLYSDIIAVITDISPATDDVGLGLQMGYNNGGTVVGSTSDYSTSSSLSGTTPWTVSSTTTRIVLSAEGVGSAAGETFSGTIYLRSLGSTSQEKGLKADVNYTTSAGTKRDARIIGETIDAALYSNAIDTIRFLWASGNFDPAGNISVYGLKRA